MEENKNLNTQPEKEEENKKKKCAFLIWWLDLSKAAKIAICSVAGAGLVSAIVFPTLAATVWNNVSKEYTVKFDTDGGTAIPDIKVKEGNKVARPTTDPEKTDYTFDNWYTTKEGTDIFNFNSTIKQDTTIYAHYIDKTTNIEYDNDLELYRSSDLKNTTLGTKFKATVKYNGTNQYDCVFFADGDGKPYTEIGYKDPLKQFNITAIYDESGYEITVSEIDPGENVARLDKSHSNNIIVYFTITQNITNTTYFAANTN